jgi:hypothetical protein
MIPKILHQIWIGPGKAPSALMATWPKLHPDWEYRLWSNHEGWENQAQIDAMPEWNGKADIMRWEILERWGGVLVDADSECIKPLDESFLHYKAFACWENEIACPGLIAAGYVGTEKGSPLMRACIDRIKGRVLSGKRAWETVGPGLLTEVARQVPQSLYVYPSRAFIPKHHTGVDAPGNHDIYAKQYWGSTFGYDKVIPSSSAGRWNAAYQGVSAIQPYGDITTYKLGAAYLKGLCVEDWGCGLGWMRNYIEASLYTGVDGSHTPFANKIVDLCEYRSTPEAIFMRHVLEHNERWLDILRNAVASFQRRMVLVLFTPWQETTRKLAVHEYTPGVFIPDFGFSEEDIVQELKPHLQKKDTLQTHTQYGLEHVFYCEKQP